MDVCRVELQSQSVPQAVFTLIETFHALDKTRPPGDLPTGRPLSYQILSEDQVLDVGSVAKRTVEAVHEAVCRNVVGKERVG